MAVTAASFKANWPAFAAVPDLDVERAIGRVERRTNRAAWAGKADDGVELLVAHMLTVEANIAAAGAASAVQGPITSKTAGPVRISYASTGAEEVSFSDGWFSASAYGRQYVELRSTIFADRCL
jgi:hypothetical protein